MTEPDGKPAAQFLKKLGGIHSNPATGLESGASGLDLSATRRKSSREALEATMKQNAQNSPAAVDGDQINQLLAQADTAMSKLASEGAAATFTAHEEFALEAVVETDGSRPSIPMTGDDVDPSDPRVGQWAGHISDFRSEIRKAAQATARIVINGSLSENSVAGTAWMIAPGLAATAKHVVEHSFEQHGNDEWTPTFGKSLTLDFHAEVGAARPDERIDIERAVWASSNIIGTNLNLANLDIAVLQLKEEGPPPVQLASTLDFPPGDAFVHVIGHPVRPMFLGRLVGDEFEQLRDLIFGDGFGIKRWSPGIIRVGPGTLTDDVNAHVMTHDASTLGGNSGSGVFDLTSFGDRAVGLHYGGFFERENYSHPTEVMKPHFEPLSPTHQMFV